MPATATSDLLTPHKEHRLVSTRLWLLLWLVLEGYWDTIVQAIVNALMLLGAYLSLAGGATTVIAAFSVCAAQLAAGSRRGVREWAAAVGAVAALLVGDIPVHPTT